MATRRQWARALTRGRRGARRVPVPAEARYEWALATGRIFTRAVAPVAPVVYSRDRGEVVAIQRGEIADLHYPNGSEPAIFLGLSIRQAAAAGGGPRLGVRSA